MTLAGDPGWCTTVEQSPQTDTQWELDARSGDAAGNTVMFLVLEHGPENTLCSMICNRSAVVLDSTDYSDRILWQTSKNDGPRHYKSRTKYMLKASEVYFNILVKNSLLVKSKTSVNRCSC